MHSRDAAGYEPLEVDWKHFAARYVLTGSLFGFVLVSRHKGLLKTDSLISQNRFLIFNQISLLVGLIKGWQKSLHSILPLVLVCLISMFGMMLIRYHDKQFEGVLPDDDDSPEDKTFRHLFFITGAAIFLQSVLVYVIFFPPTTPQESWYATSEGSLLSRFCTVLGLSLRP
jgi:hypothetical protein